MAKKKHEARSRLYFKFDLMRILATTIAGFVGIALVEFIVGMAFYPDFMANPVFNASAGMTGLISYIVGASVVFGVVFYLLERSTIPHTNFKEGLRLGFLYGVIAAAPLYILNFFLTTHTQAYMLGSLIVLLLDYTIAGALAGFVLNKMTPEKR
jgi:sugar phosphate permease